MLERAVRVQSDTAIIAIEPYRPIGTLIVRVTFGSSPKICQLVPSAQKTVRGAVRF
ncbi:MAG: hypothetical protein AB4368_24315 [Xenococcaceae cyanobacterium]